MRTRRVLRVSACIVAALAIAVVAVAGELSDDLAARRTRLMDRLAPESMLILWSAPAQRYSADIDYEYRQDSHLYYLTAVAQEETMLIPMPGNRARREILFVKDSDPVQEHWRGRRLTIDEARARTGIETVLPTSQFEPFLTGMLTRRGFAPVMPPEAMPFLDALAADRARIAVVHDAIRGAADAEPPPIQFVNKLREKFTGFSAVNVKPIFDELRTVKTPHERVLLTRSVEISSEAHLAGMRAARPGAFEYEVKAAIEAVHRGRGAVSWSYPSIVGSGPNATILHYPGGERQMRAGELLLVDAACNYGYMAADITRTYPVSGTFTPLQRDIYRVVLQAQEEGIKAARPGASLRDVHAKTVEVIKAGLLTLGLITDPTGDQYKLWFTHGTSHYLGIDVHDVGSTAKALAPGMAFTIEPGIYVRQVALDALPKTPENLAFIERVQPAVRKYADIGVRIEDSFLMDERGLRNLSGSLPKTIDAIEAFMRGRPPAPSRVEGSPPGQP